MAKKMIVIKVKNATPKQMETITNAVHNIGPTVVGAIKRYEEYAVENADNITLDFLEMLVDINLITMKEVDTNYGLFE